MKASRKITCGFAAGAFLAALAVSLFFAAKSYPFGKNKVNREVPEWSVVRTVHFDIYYPRGMETLARATAQMAEEGYVHLANALCHELTMVIPIVIYPSHIDFQNNNIIMSIIGEGVGGFTETLKNRVVVPFTGSYGEFRHVLVHELTHAFQFNMLFHDTSGAEVSRFSAGGIPLWIMEGLAEYLSAGYDETADMVMRDILFNEHYATLMDLTRLHVKNGYLLYKEGQAFFYFLESVYGRGILGEFFRDIRDLEFDDAVKIHTGKTLSELNREWARFFKRRYFHLVKGRKFVDEEGEQLTFHMKTYSSFNTCPAVSPDGKEIAYLSNRNIYTGISILSWEERKKKEGDDKERPKAKSEMKKRKVRTIVTGDNNARFEGMHLLSNNLSWSGNGKFLSFVSQSNGRDVIFLIDPKSGNVRREIRLPFRGIRDPALSRDGDLVSFVGQDNRASDIYLYDIPKKKLTRLTDDLYSDRYPGLSPDKKFVVFSSNKNPEGNIEKEKYIIHKIDLATLERSTLVENGGSNLQADLSSDGRSMLFISNRTGIYNTYRLDLESGKEERLTNVLCGTFYPRFFPDGKSMAFVGYQNLGYDIFMKDISSPGEPPSEERDTGFLDVSYRPSYFDLSRSVLDEYRTRISPDYVVVFGGGAVSGGAGVLTAFTQMGLSDYLGNHRVVGTINYVRYNGGDATDYNLAYFYMKHRWDYGVGAFRQRNPFFGIYSLQDIFIGINSMLHSVYLDTISMDRYGGYVVASYPFSRFFRFNLAASSSRYEWDYARHSGRPDVFANLNQLSASLNYDNVLWGFMVPLDGMRGRLEATQSVNLTGQDFVYSSAEIDLRRYFLVYKRYVFAFRGTGGTLMGPDRDYFKYYMGGFNTLRGHPIFAYSGTNMFLGSAEFRFIFVEGIKFGWPLFFRMGGIGGVLFADCGSAWDREYRFRDPVTGRFDDFKADLGFGFRLTLYPLIILKLDFAWPHYYNEVGDRDIIFSLGFEF
jgi:Tol biopolymer transport system component